jgi:triosephosphate isomerase (TIM)
LFIAGNWKLNCNISEALDLSSSISNILSGKNIKSEVVLFPPYIYLDPIRNIIKDNNISIGAQNCSNHVLGAYTGDISASMLSSIGCEYVIVGHSERRIGKLESNSDIALKANNVINSNMIPIICLGENAKAREEGNALKIIENQLNESIPKNIQNKNFIIAYEPIWAIGSGNIPSLDSINEMFNMIRQWLLNNNIDKDTKILYGGSVNKDNAKELFSCENLGGLLIGGVSLKAREFSEICLIAG